MIHEINFERKSRLYHGHRDLWTVCKGRDYFAGLRVTSVTKQRVTNTNPSPNTNSNHNPNPYPNPNLTLLQIRF